MQERVIKVFFGEDCLPYKDSERSVHFPILGSAFMNASNTTEIRFYCKDIGGDNRTWIVIGKLPNGKRGFKFLGSSQTDSETGEKYFSFHLNQFFTQYKGDLYLSLGGYSGSLEELSEYDTYELSANAIVETTGAIKLNIAYATPLSGSDTEIDTWQGFLAELGTKANKDQVIIKYTLESTLYSEYSNFDDYQAFYCVQTNRLYMKYEDELVVLTRFDIGFITFTRLAITTSVTDEQLIEITKPHCLAYDIYSGRIYIKSRYLGNVCTFASPTISSDSTGSGDEQYTTLRQDGVFEVNTETKALTLVSTSLALYNKNQSNNRFAIKSGDNTFSGENTFSNYLPQSNIVITDSTPNTVLITKQYLIDYLAPHISDYETLLGVVNGILGLIPSQASSSNQLADKNFVNSTVATQTSTFLGNLDCETDLDLSYGATTSSIETALDSYTFDSTPTNNDYCYVTNVINNNTLVQRFKYNDEEGWLYEYALNNSSFTATEWQAIDSGITSTLVGQIGTNQTNIATINSKLPKVKDFTISTDTWQLDSVSGRYYCEIDAGGDFVFTDTQVKYYSGISANDQNIISVYGVIVSSSATTQKFRFECYRNNVAPSETLNYTICIMGE